jgi:NADPH:quinone reductase-like Zn-dependent oxidoreductase
MIANLPSHGLQFTSTLTAEGKLELTLAEVPVAQPGPNEVVVRIEAAPINPTDLLASLIAAANLAEARFEGTPQRPRVIASVKPEAAQRRTQAGQAGKPLAAGLEGAGVVVAAGKGAEALLGKNVTMLSLTQGMFAQYCTISTTECLVLPEGTTTTEGAAAFINPLTALAMVETLRQENHTALIHTAAASNLGRMLVKICQEDGVPLVNVVRKQEQVDLLRGLGATHVCNSSAPSFHEDLVRAITATGATVAFDATGGGSMASQLLWAMETVAASRMAEFNPHGSHEPKQVYIYGHLDPTPLTLSRANYGLRWGLGGWAMPTILARAGAERNAALRQRVLAGLKTTFASHYTRTISLAEALQRDVMLAYHRQATGEKYLINPTL